MSLIPPSSLASCQMKMQLVPAAAFLRTYDPYTGYGVGRPYAWDSVGQNIFNLEDNIIISGRMHFILVPDFLPNRYDFVRTRYLQSGRQYLKCCHLGDDFWEKLHKVKTIFVTDIVGKATKHLSNLSKNSLKMVWTIFQPF